MSLRDNLKLIQALKDPTKTEELKKAVLFPIKFNKACELSVICIAEGLGEPNCITDLVISAGQNAFLPLCVVVTADGETRQVESVQPTEADFDYAAMAEDFNPEIEENAEKKQAFLEKTAQELTRVILENGAAEEGFCVRVTDELLPN
ncbi:MAG TPA: hypothetical protein DDY98_04135 [Ruminococcaceae bacterium]|nr:hypothetical protein [Oscillospiraceae bacterium]